MTFQAPLPPGIIVVLALVAALAVTLDVVALVDLYRRKPEEVTFGNKWLWVAVIVLLSLIGAILYLVQGRVHSAPPESLPLERDTNHGSSGIAEKLYGPRNDKRQR
jgi:hypothetical protein